MNCGRAKFLLNFIHRFGREGKAPAAPTLPTFYWQLELDKYLIVPESEYRSQYCPDAPQDVIAKDKAEEEGSCLLMYPYFVRFHRSPISYHELQRNVCDTILIFFSDSGRPN